jgi:phage-related protein
VVGGVNVQDILIRILGNSRDAEQALNRIARKVLETGRMSGKPKIQLTGIKAAEAELAGLAAELVAFGASSTDHEVHVKVDQALTRISLLQTRLQRALKTPSAQRDAEQLGKLFADVAKEAGNIGQSFGSLAEDGGKLNSAFQGPLGALKQLNPVLQGVAIIIITLLIPGIVALVGVLAGATAGFGALATSLGAIAGPSAIGVIAIISRISAVLKARSLRQAALNADTRKGAQADAVARQAAETLHDAHNAVRDALQSREQATRQLRQAERDAAAGIAKAQQEASDAASNLKATTTDAYRAMRDAAREAQQAVLDLQDAQLSLAESRLGIKEARLELQQLMAQAGLTGRTFQSMFKKFTDVDFRPEGVKQVLLQAQRQGQITEDQSLKIQKGVLAVDRALLSEKESVLRVKKAHDDLSDARKKEAEFATKGIRAYKPYIDALDRSATATKDLAKAEREGIKHNPQVIAARDSLRDANERLRESQHNLNNVILDQKAALEDQTGAMAIYQKARSRLSDNERRLLDDITSISAELRKSAKGATDSFTGALADGIEGLRGRIGGLGHFIKRFADTAAQNVRGLVTELKDRSWTVAINQFADGAIRAERGLGGPGLRSFLTILRNIGQAALPDLLSLLDRVVQQLQVWARATSDLGHTRSVIHQYVEDFKEVLRFIGAVVGAFFDFGKATDRSGRGFLSSMTAGVDKFREFLQSAKGRNFLKRFFDDVLPAVKSVLGFLGRFILFAAQLIQFFAPAIKFVFDGFNLLLDVLNFVLGLLNHIPAPIRAMIGLFFPWGKLLGVVVKAFEGIGIAIARLVGDAGPLIGRLVRLFGRVVDAAKGLGGPIRAAFEFVARILGSAWSKLEPIIAVIRGGIRRIWQGLGGYVSSVFNTVMGVVRFAFNALVGAINFITSLLNKIHVTIPKWVPGLGGHSFGIDIPKITAHLAQGGIVTGATNALIGEAGKEAVIPLRKSVLAELGRSVAAAMPLGALSAAGGAGGGFGGVHIDRIILPPAPAAAVPDARHQAVQLGKELRRRGARI